MITDVIMLKSVVPITWKWSKNMVYVSSGRNPIASAWSDVLKESSLDRFHSFYNHLHWERYIDFEEMIVLHCWWRQLWRCIVHCRRSWQWRTVRMGHLAGRRHLSINRRQKMSSLIGLWWLPIVCRAVGLVNRLFICCRRMYLIWRGVVKLYAFGLGYFLCRYSISVLRLWLIRTLDLNICATSGGRSLASIHSSNILFSLFKTEFVAFIWRSIAVLKPCELSSYSSVGEFSSICTIVSWFYFCSLNASHNPFES
jgi:hypothetical protein